MNLYEKILQKQEKLAVVGLGYVGMPLAVSFAEKIDVIGFDINKAKVNEYKLGHDMTNEVGDERLKATTVFFTSDETELKNAKFHVVAVPTPVNEDTTPDLTPVIGASEIVGRNLTKGSIVVYESTVYPGVTEEVCVPILEKLSGLKCGVDFKIGYSPERINPGDRVHTVDKIIKIVSGMDEEALNEIADVYSLIIKAGVFRAESIKVAEAAKVIENSQRDINIAFMNELSIIFNKMGIDTKAVLEAAGTKWNFLKFYPGLVGGHCIGVDPYYLTYKAQQLGYHSQVILSGRKINDDMGRYVAEQTVKQLIKSDNFVKGARVLLMGITFKENVPDIRNSKVIDIIKELKEYGIEVLVTDPLALEEEVDKFYGLKLQKIEEIENVDAVVLAVAHNDYLNISLENLKKKFKSDKSVLIDIKGIFDKNQAKTKGFAYWRL